MANKQIKLPVVTPQSQASTLVPDSLPAFKSTEDTDLLCGSCSGVIGANITTKTITSLTPAPTQLIVKCPVCGAHNHIAG